MIFKPWDLFKRFFIFFLSHCFRRVALKEAVFDFELPVCVVTEHRPVRGLHHVPGLWPADAARPEEDGGRAPQNERGAQRRQAEGKGYVSIVQTWAAVHLVKG